MDMHGGMCMACGVQGAQEHNLLDVYCMGRRRALGAEELHRQPRVQKAQRDAVLTAVGLDQLQLV
jgi:hypothetical protein